MSRSASATSSAASSVQPPAKTARRAKSCCSRRSEQVVAPLDRRPQRLLARVGVAAALEQVEPPREALEDLRRREHASPARRRARPPAAGCRAAGRARRSSASGSSLRALAEQRDGLRLGERRHRVLDLAPHAQQLAARHEQRRLGQRLERARRAPAPPRSPARGCRARAAARARRCARRARPWRRASARSSRVTSAGSRSVASADPEDAGLELGHERRRGLDGEPRLARAAGPGQRDEAGAVLEQRAATSATSSLPADERARRPRQVRVRDRLERREALGSPSWKIATGSAMSLSRCSPRSVSVDRRRAGRVSPARAAPGRRGRRRRCAPPSGRRRRRSPRR